MAISEPRKCEGRDLSYECSIDNRRSPLARFVRQDSKNLCAYELLYGGLFRTTILYTIRENWEILLRFEFLKTRTVCNTIHERTNSKITWTGKILQ